jgi:hypothetical protein
MKPTVKKAQGKDKTTHERQSGILQLTGNYFFVAMEFVKVGVPAEAAVALVKNYTNKQIADAAKNITERNVLALKVKNEVIEEKENLIKDLIHHKEQSIIRINFLMDEMEKVRRCLREFAMCTGTFHPENEKDAQQAKKGVTNRLMGDIYHLCYLGND